MSEQQVIDRLEEYGAWVETTAGLALRPIDLDNPRPRTVAIDLEPARVAAGNRPRGRRPWVFAAAAAALMIAGVVLAGGLGTSPDQPTVATFAQDPVGPLFMLPDPGAGYAFSDAYVVEHAVSPSNLPTQVMVVGTRDGEEYRDIASIRVDSEPPESNRGTEQVETAMGPAQLIADIPITMVGQRRQGFWITVLARPDRVPFATDLLGQVTLTTDGVAQLNDTVHADVLEDLRPAWSGTTATSYHVATDSPEESIVVEAASAPSPLLLAGGLVDKLVLTPLRDTEGWSASRQDPEGEWNGIAWQVTPNRVVAVSGHVALSEVRAVAESLTIVDEATWKAALPDYSEAPT